MSTSGWRILLLVVTANALPDPSFSSSRDHARERRQIADTSHLNDREFICSFDPTHESCKQNPPPVPDPDSEVVPGSCSCALSWQCKDKSGSTDPGNFLTQVNVRTVFSLCPKPEEVCCKNIDTTLEPQIAPFSPTCGKRNSKGVVTNFVGFENRQSQFGEFPWMAAVMTSKKFGSNPAPLYICGGSLIHGQVVLTAAHYMQGKAPEELTVRLGEWNFKEQSEPVSHQEYGVQEIVMHPNYNKANLAYDVALLVLNAPVNLDHTIDTICLPPENYDFKDHTCVVSGWGKDIFSEVGKYQQILKSIDLPPVGHSACEAAMRGTRLGPSFQLHHSFICAGGEQGKDACEGDGGSPLACHKNGDPSIYYQAGVVSWGIGCGDAGIPGVYADISKAVSWINSVISQRFGHDVRIGGK